MQINKNRNEIKKENVKLVREGKERKKGKSKKAASAKMR